MTKLDDAFINWAAIWAIFSISNTGQELPDIKDRIKSLILDLLHDEDNYKPCEDGYYLDEEKLRQKVKAL